MKMFNYEIDMFLIFLFEQAANAKDSRMRTRFRNLALEHKKLVDSERIDLAKQYSYKDENGEAQTVEKEDGSSAFKIKDQEAFAKEYSILMNEEFIIEETEERKDMLNSIRNIVLNTEATFKGEEALIYDRYCDIVES
jgi:hypothetical protein